MTLLLSIILLSLTILATSAPIPPPLPDPLIKFYNPKSRSFTNASFLWENVASANVIFLGEEHDHEYGHYLEALVAEYLISLHKNSSAPLALSLEMFERDTQEWLTYYLAGEVTEKAFLGASRPWPNYETDYRRMVEGMKAAGHPVLAANVPRRYAHHVTLGLENALFMMPEDELNFMAERIIAPQEGVYWDKFYDLFKDSMPLEKIILYYRAQCLKDDTMTRSIEEWWNTTKASAPERHLEAPAAPAVVHVDAAVPIQVLSCTGGFHVEDFAGLYEKIGLRMPSARRFLVSMRSYDPSKPFPDLKEFATMGDLVVFMPPKRHA